MSADELRHEDCTFTSTYMIAFACADCPRILVVEYDRAVGKQQNELAANQKMKGVKRNPGTPVRKNLNYRIADGPAGRPGARMVNDLFL